METKYVCSYCDETISVGEKIVLVAVNEVGEKGIILLHTELGNYSTECSPGLIIHEGELVKLSCPICNHNLTNKDNERLAHFVQVTNEEKRFHIVISAIYGEKCTYKVEERKVIETFGDHWARYQNPDWFLLF